METGDLRQFTVRFEDVSSAQAAEKIKVLREEVLDASSDIKGEIRKDNPSTLDFGATLVLVLAAPAVVELAKAVKAYMGREREGTLTIEENGKVIFRGNSADAAKIASAFAKGK